MVHPYRFIRTSFLLVDAELHDDITEINLLEPVGRLTFPPRNDSSL